MVMVAFGGPIRLSPPRLDRLTRRMRWDQALAPVSDEVPPAGLEQRFADLEVVLGLEELEQGPLELAVAQVPGGVDLFTRERVEARVIHARCDVERRGDE